MLHFSFRGRNIIMLSYVSLFYYFKIQYCLYWHRFTTYRLNNYALIKKRYNMKLYIIIITKNAITAHSLKNDFLFNKLPFIDLILIFDNIPNRFANQSCQTAPHAQPQLTTDVTSRTSHVWDSARTLAC